MDQRHDYDQLMNSHALTHPGAHAPVHALAPHGHPQHPHMAGHAPAPPPAMVPAHEVGAILHGLRSDIASLHNQQRHAPPPPAHHPHPHAPPPPPHYADDYDHQRAERPRTRRDREREHAARRRERGDREDREFPVGFVSQTPVAPGALAEIEVKPQVSFQGHRLAVKASQARYFNIVDIKVGKDSQLAATGEMPAEAFSSLAVGTQMELDRAEPGIVITLIVRNTDTAAQDFGAVLYGTVEEN